MASEYVRKALSVSSHRLRNILTGGKGFNTLLRKCVQPDELFNDKDVDLYAKLILLIKDNADWYTLICDIAGKSELMMKRELDRVPQDRGDRMVADALRIFNLPDSEKLIDKLKKLNQRVDICRIISDGRDVSAFMDKAKKEGKVTVDMPGGTLKTTVTYQELDTLTDIWYGLGLMMDAFLYVLEMPA